MEERVGTSLAPSFTVPYLSGILLAGAVISQEKETQVHQFFKPRNIELGRRRITFFRSGKPAYKVVVADSASQTIYEAARIVCQAINHPEERIMDESRGDDRFHGIYLCTPDGPSAFAKMVGAGKLPGTPVNRDQAFEIVVTGHDVVIMGYTPQALMYGARAFADLVQVEGNAVWIPEVKVYDHPDMTYRGIYVECRWGPDSMTLDQWKDAIDELSAMRMNIMSIGLYNNWPIQYDGIVSEWMMVPIKTHPELKTTKLVNYYSPSQKKDIRLEYVPRIYEEDLFGKIIQYAKSKGIIVRPHFNTPGHNTLIPRQYPETSAKFPDGRPKNYGFCMSNPATFRVMFDILDEICDRYLLPNQIDWFHIGMDEVYPLVGMNPETPLLRIDPWCECPECSKTSPEDRFVNYAVCLAKHLRDKGINNIGMWHDHFARGGKMNEELTRRFEQEGLRDSVILHWWCYSDFFDTTKPEMGLRRWVVPMTGYFYWINYTDHSHNIFWAIDKGVEESAEGVESYGVWHPSFHQHYIMLAAKSWNSDRWQSPAQLREMYARALFDCRWKQGLRGLGYFDNVTGGGGMINYLSRLFAYPYLYANSKEDAYIRENYPQAILEQLVQNPMNVLGFLGQTLRETQKAISIFESMTDCLTTEQERIIRLYLVECQRIASVLDLFLKMANAVKHVRAGADSGKVQEVADEVEHATERLESAMLAIEQTWDSPFVPQALRELTLMRRFAVELGKELRTNPCSDLRVMQCKEIQWMND